jgi:hypothetical protein
VTNSTRAFLTLLVASSFLAGCGAASQRGATTEREVIERFLDAVQRQDVDALRRLVPSTHRAESELPQAAHGTRGAPLEAGAVTLRFSTDFPSRYASVDITGRYHENGVAASYAQHLELEKIDGRWYLIMGKAAP